MRQYMIFSLLYAHLTARNLVAHPWSLSAPLRTHLQVKKIVTLTKTCRSSLAALIASTFSRNSFVLTDPCRI